MVVGNFDDDLLGPDLLVDQDVAIVHVDDKVYCAFEDQRLMFSDVQTEEERVLCG